MRNFSIAVDIDAPATRVWEVMTDVERWSSWTSSITSITLVGGGPLGAGKRAWIRQPGFPPALWTVTELQAGRAFTWVNAAPGLRAVATHTIEPTPAGSRVTLALHYGGLFGGILGRLMSRVTTRFLRLEADGLAKESISSRGRGQHSGTTS